jgi:ABC-2 type transport system permease protein
MIMQSLRRISALFVKEIFQISRDPSSILIVVILPLILLFLMGYAISLNSKHIALGIVVEKSSKQTQSLVNAFQASPSFNVQVAHTTQELSREMQTGKIYAMLVIPSTFAKDLSLHRVKLQVITDGSEPNTAGFTQKYVSEIWFNWLAQEGLDRHTLGTSIQIKSRYWFNSPLLSRYFLIPGSIAIILTLIGTLLTALVVAREWERGTMEAIMSTPITIVEFLLGKLLPYYFLGIVSLLVCVLIALFWFDLPFRGSYWLLFISSSVYLFPTLGLGLLISTLAKNQFVAAQAALIAGFLPSLLLSGFLFPIASMPGWLQGITHVIPARYFVSILQTLFLSGNFYDIIMKNLLYMFLLGSVFFIIIMKITKKRLD